MRPINRLRLGWPLALAWSIAWLSGVAILAHVAIDLRDDLRQSDIDTELALVATAVYGLTWFDATGFHDQTLSLEPDLLQGPFDIWVTSSDTVYFGPEDPQFAITDLASPGNTSILTSDEVYLDGQDRNGRAYRLHSIPHFRDDHPDPVAAIVVVGDTLPGYQALASFSNSLYLAAAIVGVAGLLIGVILTGLSLRPVALAYDQRERFIAATAHEFRSPLAALRGVCDSGLQGDMDSTAALQKVSGLVDHATHTVEDLLMFARMDGGARAQLEPVRLDLLVDTVLGDYPHITLQATPCVALIDTRLATAAIRNLIENAHRHGGDTVRVKVKNGRVEISDDGDGFDTDLLDGPISEFSISPTQTGSGLGLAIASLAARLHGGHLSLNNGPNGGAIAAISFRCQENVS